MPRKNLKTGFTTGACAAAAAKGAAQLLRDQQMVDEVEIILPQGDAVRFRLQGQFFTPTRSGCHVVKDAGDDPDVTNGAEIHATITLEENTTARPGLIIEGGVGVGKVTKPGLAVPVGEWAINPVPRLMIRHAVHEVFAIRCVPLTRRVTISIPNGEELAKKTLNARLGIIGGLSILGTSGIVTPISTSAWTETISTAIDVALACGAPAMVFATGRSSEMVAQRHKTVAAGLPEEAYVMMGDHVGFALRAAAAKGVRRLTLAGQFAKVLKIACGHEQTHVSSSQLDLGVLAGWVRQEMADPRLAERVATANTAREVLETYPRIEEICTLVCTRARDFARSLAPEIEIQVLLVGYGGEETFFLSHD